MAFEPVRIVRGTDLWLTLLCWCCGQPWPCSCAVENLCVCGQCRPHCGCKRRAHKDATKVQANGSR